MMKNFLMAAVFAAVLAVGASANAQVYATYMPVGPVPVAAYYAPPVVGYGVGYGPVVATSYYAPVASYYAAPTPYLVASPYYAASPIAVGAPLYYGRPVVVHPKYYYPGRPVRNVIRAVTP